MQNLHTKKNILFNIYIFDEDKISLEIKWVSTTAEQTVSRGSSRIYSTYKNYKDQLLMYF